MRWQRLLLLSLILPILSGCVEYRLHRQNEERYISLMPMSKRKLDPKLGSKAKLWVMPGEDVRIYLGGDVRDAQYVTTSLGLMMYPSDNSSIEVGIRTLLYQTDDFKPYDRDFDVDLWEDSPRLFYIGGVLIF